MLSKLKKLFKPRLEMIKSIEKCELCGKELKHRQVGSAIIFSRCECQKTNAEIDKYKWQEPEGKLKTNKCRMCGKEFISSREDDMCALCWYAEYFVLECILPRSKTDKKCIDCGEEILKPLGFLDKTIPEQYRENHCIACAELNYWLDTIRYDDRHQEETNKRLKELVDERHQRRIKNGLDKKGDKR